MKSLPLLLTVVGTQTLCACSAGEGAGAASGFLYAYGCSLESGDYSSGGIPGTEAEPAPYDLKPTFFAGEPIDDLRQINPGSEVMSNRLIIRLQASGKQIEQNDVLTFDVTSSYEVARCVRGRIDPETGKKDWNEADCFRASDDGPGRMRVQFDSSVHAALTPRSTCPSSIAKPVLSNLVGDAVSAPVPPSYATAQWPVVSDGGWTSWIEFQEFGSASQRDQAPTERTAIKGKFRVELGDRVYATSFFLTLIDDGVVQAAMSNQPRPPSLIGGTLGGDPSTGWFDFDLQRGQGAQFFP